MRKLIIILWLLIFSSSALAQSIIEDWVKVDHAYTQGVYWNPDELPGWGFFVDIQKDTMFGAVYGYMGPDSTFITLQGTIDSIDPLRFKGDVFFVTNGGAAIDDVGNFTWSVGYFEAAPAAVLSITSNILNKTNMTLVRFSYAEIDKIGVLTGGNWNIVRRIISTFADSYNISDERMVEEGETFVVVLDNEDSDRLGVASHIAPEDGDVYGMLVQFDDDTNVFYLFFASNTDMYGRYWLLDEGENPTGDGNYFRGGVDGLQVADDGNGGDPTSIATKSSPTSSKSIEADIKKLESMMYRDSNIELQPMFSDAMISAAHEKLSRIYRSNRNLTR